MGEYALKQHDYNKKWIEFIYNYFTISYDGRYISAKLSYTYARVKIYLLEVQK